MTVEQESNATVRVALLWILAAAVILIGGPIVLYRYVATPAYTFPPDTDIAEVATGTWSWEDGSCDDAPQSIWFADDRSEMYISSDAFVDGDGIVDSTASYRILGLWHDRVRGAIIGETRLTEAGETVVWDLVLQSPDRAAWHRTDWAPGSVTKSLVRCP